MSATLRLKQFLFIAAALALVSLGLVAALTPASPARADDTQPCVETEDSYTDWVNEGDQIRTEENNAPGADGDLVRYVFVGETDPEVITPGVAGGHYSWNGGNRGVSNPPTVVPPHADWQKNADTEPPGHLNSATWFGTPGVGLHVTGNSPTNASWFYTVASVPEVTDTDFLWQKQVRTFVPGNDCPPPPPVCVPEDYNGAEPGCGTPPEECEPEDYNGAEPGCGTPPEECVPEDYNGAEPGCGTPPEEKPWVCHPVEGNGELGNGWNLIKPDQASSHIDELLFPDGEYWKHETNDGRHDIYSEDGETCPDAEEPELCPEGSDHAGEPFPDGESEESCNEEPDPGPGTCPEGTDKAGQEIPQGQSEEEFCDEDHEEEVCPDESDKPGETIPEGESEEEFCDEDDVDPGPTCEEDPSQEHCDKDNPPVVVPDDGTTPDNGPSVKGAQATSPTSVAPAAGTPAAAVPTAINSGLAPGQRELSGAGGGLGLVGIATALLGAALVGLTVRPRRRIGASSSPTT